MKTIWKLGLMTVNYKIILLLLGVMLFAGLTGCNQKKEVIAEITQSSTRSLVTVNSDLATWSFE